MSLNTKKLKELCQNVVRDIGNENDIPKSLDEGWARLCYESLPELKEFFLENENDDKRLEIIRNEKYKSDT